MSSGISIIAKSLLSEAGLDSGGYATRALKLAEPFFSMFLSQSPCRENVTQLSLWNGFSGQRQLAVAREGSTARKCGYSDPLFFSFFSFF